MRCIFCIKTSLLSEQGTTRCHDFLAVQVVDCWMHKHQLSEEAALEGVFIGNTPHGGILDTEDPCLLNGYAACGASSS